MVKCLALTSNTVFPLSFQQQQPPEFPSRATGINSLLTNKMDLYYSYNRNVYLLLDLAAMVGLKVQLLSVYTTPLPSTHTRSAWGGRKQGRQILVHLGPAKQEKEQANRTQPYPSINQHKINTVQSPFPPHALHKILHEGVVSRPNIARGAAEYYICLSPTPSCNISHRALGTIL